MGDNKIEKQEPGIGPDRTWTEEKSREGTELIIDSGLSIFIPKITLDQLPIFDTTYDTPSDRHMQPVEQIARYFAHYRKSGIPPRDVPNKLRDDENSPPTANVDFLTKSLIPPREFRAGTLTDSTKALLEHRAQEALANGNKLQIHVGPLEQVNLSQLSEESSNHPTFFDVMFLDRVKEILDHVKGYPFGTELQILSNPVFPWISDPYFDEHQIREGQAQFHEEYSRVVQQLLSVNHDNLTINLQSPLHENPSLLRRVKQKRLDLQNLFDNLIPHYQNFAKSLGVESGSWKTMKQKQFRNSMSGSDDHYPIRVAKFMASPAVEQLFKDWNKIGLKEYTPYAISNLVNGLNMYVHDTAKNTHASKVTEYEQNAASVEFAMRMLAYELTMNEIYLSGEDHNQLSVPTTSTVRLLPGQLQLYPRPIYDRFGISLASLIIPDSKRYRDSTKFGIAPAYQNPKFRISADRLVPSAVTSQTVDRAFYTQGVPPIQVRLTNLKPFILPVELPIQFKKT